MADGMKASRRRFFGIAAAPVVIAAAPAVAAPVVEMVEADIAPVIVPRTERSWYQGYEQDITVDYIQTDLRARMVALANRMDAELRAAINGGYNNG